MILMKLFDIINVPMGYVIRFFNQIVGNHYVLALLLFAVLVEIILLPFGIKQQKNSIKQAKLRPKEMAIRKKYAGRDDKPTKQKMSMEIQELYQKEGYNPMGGCLPMLIQLPIIIALYNLVMNPLYYICRLSNDAIQEISTVVSAYTGKAYDAARNINLLGDMQNLDYSNFANVEGFTEEMYNNLPNLKMFGGAIDLAKIPELSWPPTWLILVPVLTFVAYFASTKVSRKLTYQPQADDKAMGCSNSVMDVMMPLVSVYIAFIVPAAIGVYWIFKSVIGMIKQVILHFAMPAPKFTEEDYKAAEKEMAAEDAKAGRKKSEKSGRVVRSLHHIDDEDFADTAEAGKARREALEAQAAADEEARANRARGNALKGDAPALKEDDRPERKKKNKKEKEAEADGSDTNDNTNKDGE